MEFLKALVKFFRRNESDMDRLKRTIEDEYFKQANIHELHESNGLGKFDPDVK